MNIEFFAKYMLTIAKRRHSQLLFKKEKLYYKKYVTKLSYHIQHLETNDIDKALAYVDRFKSKQVSLVDNSFFVKPKNMLSLACEDAKDVLKGMRRYDGVEVESWDFWVGYKEVNLGRVSARE